jgi:putative heme-binding domain-containing protein
MRLIQIAAATLMVLCIAAGPASGPATAPAPLPVHMLVPGFTVRELPVRLTNLNNVAYGPDGRLYAVGYDGRVHVLVDSDGDGLEDTVLPWCYDHAADMRAPVGMIIRPEGMYIASKGRVSLLKDTTGKGVADQYEVVVGGWQEIKNNVDALGVAIDKEGNLYYGRGAEDYRNPLLVDKDGVPHYDLKAESGTVIRVSPDRKKREIIATGIRFTVALGINREGDLFATDQEGATWVPNGNPLDKIEQIIPGRHYGFPPKSLNPAYLKDVVDEPPVVAFGPQHQSGCGMKFNERTDKQPSFGPDFWEGDAIVAGESRGKIWRCPLVRLPMNLRYPASDFRYIGKPIIIAALDMLTLDVAISPTGDLVVCCHSGNPDWGTGPKGVGRLFKISYTGRNEPQPVIAWPASRNEIRIAFDRPLDPFVLSTSKSVIGGKYVRAADRIELLKPPYAAVKQQEATPRASVRVLSQKLDDDGRTLVLAIDPLPWRAMYSVAVPGVKAVGEDGAGTTVDVDFSLCGVTARDVEDGEERPPQEFWLPHLSEQANARYLGAATAGRLLRLPGRGSVTLKTLLNLEGTRAALSLRSAQPCEATVGSQRVPIGGSMNAGSWGKIETDLRGDLPIEIITRGGAPLDISLTYHTSEDATERPIPFERLILPWAKDLPPAPDAPVEHKKLGDWTRGRALFYGEAQCANCHIVRGQGGVIGPDLSNLTFKDPQAVLGDILNPSAAINPDYVSYVVKLKNGESITGLVAAEGAEQFKVTEGVGKVTSVRRADVESLTPSTTSLMPDIFKALGEEKLNDIVEFLTGEKPQGVK